MASSGSAWAKPISWALDAEQHEAAMAVAKDDSSSTSDASDQQQRDFPSLAAATKGSKKKKKKAQSMSLAEFTTGKPVSHNSSARLAFSSSSAGLTPDELLLLPTGPRERSAEELERSSFRGFGQSYGGARGRAAASGEDPNPSRWGPSRPSDEPRRGGFGGSGGGSDRDLGPSRADEVDDWGSAKKSVVPERRERGGAGGFFESQSKADESDSWISSKRTAPPADGRRFGSGGGFDGPREGRGGFDMFTKEGSNGGGADSETWGRKKDVAGSAAWRREEEKGSDGRRRLVLQPRSLLLSNGNNGEPAHGEQDKGATEKKTKGSNPFGEARPREEVLAEKGQDWKKIDEKLETRKIGDAPPERSSFGKKVYGAANGTQRSPEGRTDRGLGGTPTQLRHQLQGKTRLRTQHLKFESYTNDGLRNTDSSNRWAIP
ncbi:unnamed protein product [Musa banksii]